MEHPLADVDVAVLAGGMGTRLRSVVSDRPKVLADVAGRPFLAHLLDRLAAAGARRCVLCTGYLGDQVEAAFGAAYGPLVLAYSRETEPLGTAGALRLALPFLRTPTVLAMNGDSFWDVDLGAACRAHRGSGAAATLVLTQVEDTGRFGRVEADEAGRVLEFREKGASGPGWINAGVYFLTRPVLESIPEGRAVSIEREIFPAWVGRGLHGWRGEGRILDIGTPESYAEAEAFLRGGGR